MKIDWTKYNELFPDRYLSESTKLDEELKKIIFKRIDTLISLDIGGNINGTELLKFTKAYFLDPFVIKPHWYIEQLDWDDIWSQKYKFDLIVCKNSINYLSDTNIGFLPELLTKDGIFIANSFFLPNEINREFKNSNSGKNGIERTEFRDGIIHHYLEFDGQTIEHTFNYYSIEQYIDMFEGFNPNFQITGKNSMIIKIQKT